MAEEKKSSPPAPVLGAAGESCDPAVQIRLAQRAGFVLNGDDKAVERVDQELAALGVTV